MPEEYSSSDSEPSEGHLQGQDSSDSDDNKHDRPQVGLAFNTELAALLTLQIRKQQDAALAKQLWSLVSQDVPFEVFLKRMDAQQAEQGAMPRSGPGQRGRLASSTQADGPDEVAKPKRENKNRPVEASAKRPVKRHRDVVEGLGRQVGCISAPPDAYLGHCEHGAPSFVRCSASCAAGDG